MAGGVAVGCVPAVQQALVGGPTTWWIHLGWWPPAGGHLPGHSLCNTSPFIVWRCNSIGFLWRNPTMACLCIDVRSCLKHAYTS